LVEVTSTPTLGHHIRTARILPATYIDQALHYQHPVPGLLAGCNLDLSNLGPVCPRLDRAKVNHIRGVGIDDRHYLFSLALSRCVWVFFSTACRASQDHSVPSGMPRRLPAFTMPLSLVVRTRTKFGPCFRVDR